jgi:hypothetical protein
LDIQIGKVYSDDSQDKLLLAPLLIRKYKLL